MDSLHGKNKTKESTPEAAEDTEKKGYQTKNRLNTGVFSVLGVSSLLFLRGDKAVKLFFTVPYLDLQCRAERRLSCRDTCER